MGIDGTSIKKNRLSWPRLEAGDLELRPAARHARTAREERGVACEAALCWFYLFKLSTNSVSTNMSVWQWLQHRNRSFGDLDCIQSYRSKGIWRQGDRHFCKTLWCFDTMPGRHTPLLVHFRCIAEGTNLSTTAHKPRISLHWNWPLRTITTPSARHCEPAACILGLAGAFNTYVLNTLFIVMCYY